MRRAPSSRGSSAAGAARPASSASAAAAFSRAVYRRLRPDEAGGGAELPPTCNILVLEFCDKGSLRRAARRGAFHRPLPDGTVAANVPAMADALLDTANALHYLHSLRIVHNDVKARPRAAPLHPQLPGPVCEAVGAFLICRRPAPRLLAAAGAAATPPGPPDPTAARP
jgi:hypothetical protein